MRFVRRVLLLLLVFVLLSACLPAGVVAEPEYPLSPSSAVIQDALWYLRDHQDVDGSIVGYGESAWACIAIAAAGEDPNNWDNGGPSLVDYLKGGHPDISEEFNMGTFLARMVLAAVAAGEDPSAFGNWSGSHAGVDIIDGDYLSALKSLHDGTRFLQDLTGDPDSAQTLNDDFWAVRALFAAGESPHSLFIQSSVEHIIDYQEGDGGWSWATPEHTWYASDSTDVDNTAAAIVALCLGNQSGSDAVTSALLFMGDNQNESGGFVNPISGVNVQSTAWAVDAIGAAGQNPVSSTWTPESLNPVDYLLAAQDVDGSIGDSVRSTADAIVALVGHYYVPSGEEPDGHDPPLIAYSPSRLDFEAAVGGSNPPEETLEIWNSGEGRLWWTASSDADWLSLSPSHGDSTGEKNRVTVAVDIYGLDAGEYTGRITIEDEDDSGHREQVTVTLEIEADQEEEVQVQEQDDTIKYLLVTSTNPPEAGVVAASIEPGIEGYAEGTTVTLTASPSPGYVFVGWAGDAEGTAPTATVVMSGHRSVTADFVRFDASGLGNVGLSYATPALESVTVVPYPVEGIPSSPHGFRLLSAYVVQPEGTGSFGLKFDAVGDVDNVAVFRVVNGGWAQLPRMVLDGTSLQVTLGAEDVLLVLAYPGESSTGLWERMTGSFATPGSATIIVVVIIVVLLALILLVVLVLGRRESY